MAREREVTTSLRLESELHTKLVALATRERRSLQQQIVYMLERAVELEEKKGEGQ
jgi:hypothetical protein